MEFLCRFNSGFIFSESRFKNESLSFFIYILHKARKWRFVVSGKFRDLSFQFSMGNKRREEIRLIHVQSWFFRALFICLAKLIHHQT